MDRKAARRHVLIDQFKDLLNHLDDNCAVRGPPVCPAGPCGGGGGAGYGQKAPTYPEYTSPVSTFNPPRMPDYKDPARRPLITFPDKEVQEQNAFNFSNGSYNKSPLCPVMDPRCPASFVPGAVGGGGYGAGGGYAPCANGGMDMGMGMGMGMGMPSMGSQCPATAYAGGGGGGGGRHARASPCMAAILERERQERERQEREIRERLERERIERERKELERRERDLKAREPYMCPGQAQIEKAALKEAKKAHLAGKPLDQGGRGGNGYGELRQCAQGNGNHGYKQSPEERFGPCVPVGDLAPCDPRACPASSDKHVPLQETKSRELRGGVLYTGCDCNKRNGLQHDCKRTLCQGRPECLTKPEPMCIPSGGPGYISPCYPVCDPHCWDEAVQDRYC